MRFLKISSMAFALGLLIASPVMAQEFSGDQDTRVFTSAAMDATLAGHESAVDQTRADLAQLLAQPQVRDLALERGIDIGQLESTAAGLSNDQMQDIAPLVAKTAPLVQNGLGTVTLSVGAIIIILLLLILVT